MSRSTNQSTNRSTSKNKVVKSLRRNVRELNQLKNRPPAGQDPQAWHRECQREAVLHASAVLLVACPDALGTRY